MYMKNKRFLRSNVFQGLIFILLPFLLSFMMYGRMLIVLEDYMESQVSARAAALGELASQKLYAQLDELGRVAGYYQDRRVKEETMGDSLERLLASSGRISCGILRLGGAALYGDDLPVSEYPAVLQSFRGYSTITYVEGKGLLFTVPVYNGDNIRYVLYEFCDEKDLFSGFGAGSFGGQARLILADGREQKVIPVSREWEWEYPYFSQDTMQKPLDELKEKLDTGTSASVCCNVGEGKEFLLVSEIGRENLYVVGRVPYKAVSDGIASLSNMTLLVFGLLFILLCIGTINMFSVRAKARESDELREAKRAAEEATRTMSKFVANMSHELRTPINVILGMDEMILREETGETTRERAMDIKSAAQILLGLINDVLDFSKIEAGNLNIIPVEYDFVAMVRDLVLLSESRVRQKSLIFEMEIQPDIPIGLYGDDIHIRQIMINLLTNAVKYTEKGTVTLKITGDKTGEDKVILHCLVKDTGIGIKKEDIDKLFIPYLRIEERRNRNIEGSGLGLSIIINLLKLMGSELKVESVYGEGSAFYFDLEQKIVDEEPVGDIRKRLDNIAKEYRYQVAFTAPDAHILVVDDNSMNRDLFVSLLKKTKIQISAASSGKKALAMVQQKHFDIIFMDYLMPEMDGEETLRRLRSLENNLCKNTPVIALTANAFSGSREHYMNMGFDDFLSKPIVTEKLEALIWEMLPEEYISEVPEETASEIAQEDAPASKYDGIELPDVDGVDWRYAQLFLKDKNLLIDSLQNFYGNIDTFYRKISGLAEGVDEGESLADYRICVHSLKSNSALLGILTVSKLAEVLEKAAQNNEREKVHTLTPILLEELEKMKERLQSFIEEIQGKDSEREEEKPIGNASGLLNFFAMLRFSMERMDISGTDACMRQILAHSYPEDLQEIVDRIHQKITDLDYEGAKEEMAHAEESLKG